MRGSLDWVAGPIDPSLARVPAPAVATSPSWLSTAPESIPYSASESASDVSLCLDDADVAPTQPLPPPLASLISSSTAGARLTVAPAGFWGAKKAREGRTPEVKPEDGLEGAGRGAGFRRAVGEGAMYEWMDDWREGGLGGGEPTLVDERPNARELEPALTPY